MAKRVSILGVVLLLGACGGANNPYCSSGTYVGDLHGLQATAHLSFEVLPNTTVVAGDIQSATASYTFQGDIATDPWSGPVTNVGYVDVTDLVNGERFRAQITVSAQGFLFVANAFEGLYSTSYSFTCVP